MHKLLSIITINKNNARGLTRTLKSLSDLRESAEVQFVFIDGASTDDSMQVANSFYRSEEVLSEPDTGIYNAMNKGLDLASGRYVLWLNSGDELLPFAARLFLDILRVSSSGMIGFGIQASSEFEKSQYSVWTPSIRQLPWGTFPHPGTFFLRSLVVDLGGYDEAFKIVGDRDLIMRIFFSGVSIETRQECIAHFYTGGTSDSPNAYFEVLLLRRKHGLLNTYQYYYWLSRYQVKLLLQKMSFINFTAFFNR